MKYTGKNLIRGYRKHYGVSLLCAAQELKILGIEVPATYNSQPKIAEENVSPTFGYI